MKRLLAAALLCTCLLVALVAGASTGAAKPRIPAPKGFFGIDPQGTLTDEDALYMKAGGIETVRWPLAWNGVQPTEGGPYNWAAFDPVVEVAARYGLKVLPFVYGTPAWISRKYTTLPVNSWRAKAAWSKFLEACVQRYGPGGEFWKLHAPGTVLPPGSPPLSVINRPLPIRNWQIWNEANFFYFAYPASPQRYVKLLKISSPAIKRVDPGADVILSGLFGEPTAHGARGMPAAQFLEAIYRAPGIKRYFDGIALHPYAAFASNLEEMTEALHEVTVENHDRVPLYVTEMGWGSQNDFQQDAFEQGIRGQVKQLRAAYGYLLENRNRLDLKQVYWFSWKDQKESCAFCDSVGLFREGERFHPKPAWHAFVALTGGRARP
ncbi:MAG TPA: beta-galactosidase [Solirubrobacterales bacterium]|nr:beta-galactosidase [Solirubrobacterales bacterium]